MPHRWTPDLVEEALGRAFRLRPGAMIATPGEVESLLNWRRRFLPADAEGWSYLVARAQCHAEGTRVAERRRAMGWSRDKFERGWRRAAQAIADGLNVERINRAALTAGEEAEERLERTGKIRIVVSQPRYLTS